MSDGSVIFALDGVLTNDSPEPPAEGQKMHWREQYNQEKLEQCSPNSKMVKLARQLGELNNIVIVSERPVTVSEVTRKWLSDRRIRFDVLLMKQDLKECSPTDAKTELIQLAISDNFKPWLLVDYDADVIRRANGIQGMLV